MDDVLNDDAELEGFYVKTRMTEPQLNVLQEIETQLTSPSGNKKHYVHPLVYVANRFVVEFKREYTALTGVADPTRTVDRRASE